MKILPIFKKKHFTDGIVWHVQSKNKENFMQDILPEITRQLQEKNLGGILITDNPIMKAADSFIKENPNVPWAIQNLERKGYNIITPPKLKPDDYSDIYLFLSKKSTSKALRFLDSKGIKNNVLRFFDIYKSNKIARNFSKEEGQDPYNNFAAKVLLKFEFYRRQSERFEKIKNKFNLDEVIINIKEAKKAES